MIVRGRSAVLAGALALAVVAPGPGLAWPGTAAAGPVDDALEAGSHESFSARVTVQWLDGKGRHDTTLEVRAVGGLVRVDGVTPAAGGQLVLGDGWLLVGRPGPALRLPAAVERKYEVDRLPGPEIASRPTSLVTLRSGGLLRERLAIDEATGLVLRRELFGPAGEPVRVVTVTRLDTSAPSPPAGRPVEDHAERLRPGSLERPYDVPAALAGGYQRVGAFRRGNVVHVVYSDGLHGLSLFTQPGRIDRGRLPTGGQAVDVGRSEARRYTWAGGEIVTWQSGPVVRTLVGDAASDEVLAAARSLPPAPRPSTLARLRRAARHAAEVISGG